MMMSIVDGYDDLDNEISKMKLFSGQSLVVVGHKLDWLVKGERRGGCSIYIGCQESSHWE